MSIDRFSEDVHGECWSVPDKIACQSSKNLFIESLTQVHSVAGVSDKTFATINIVRITNSYHYVDILVIESCLYTIRYLTGKLLLISDVRERRWDQLFGISATLFGSVRQCRPFDDVIMNPNVLLNRKRWWSDLVRLYGFANIINAGLILGSRQTNERRCYFGNDVFHWLGASLVSALYN